MAKCEPKGKYLINRLKKEQLSRYLSSLPMVVAAYLFGSQAVGKAGAKSDVDFAILLKNDIDRENYFGLRLQMIADLTRLLHFNNIDLIILNDASPLLIHQVLKNGELIYSTSKQKQIKFVFKAIRDYLDTMYLRKVQGEILHLRIKEGDFGHFKGDYRFTLEKVRKLSKKIAGAGQTES